MYGADHEWFSQDRPKLHPAEFLLDSLHRPSRSLIIMLNLFGTVYCVRTPQWGAADAEIKSHLVRTQSLNVLPLK